MIVLIVYISLVLACLASLRENKRSLYMGGSSAMAADEAGKSFRPRQDLINFIPLFLQARFIDFICVGTGNKTIDPDTIMPS